ncbi:MAG: T9SS-dependent M36 family metallopeptidase, partial [Aureispira sp.]
MKKLQWTGLLILCCVLSMSAQNQHELLQKFLEQHHQQQGLTKDDIANWEVTSQHISNTSGATHLYFHQTYQGIPIINGVANVAIKDGAIKSMGNRLVSNLKARIQNTAPSLSPQQAIEKAAQALQLDAPQNLRALEPISPQHFVYNKGNISKENIPVQLVYYATQEGKIKLTWDLSIYTLDAQHWWSAKIDAQTGELVQVVDWVVHCNFEHGEGPTTSHTHIQQNTHHATPSPETVQQPDQYTVYA